MSVVSTAIEAPAAHVFDALCDPWALCYLVPGARRVRRFDPRWPDPGTAVDMAGPLPVLTAGMVASDECEPDRHLLIEARTALGLVRIACDLEATGPVTTLVIDARVAEGPLSTSVGRVVGDVALTLRNLEMSRRFRHLVEARERRREAEAPRA